MRVIRFCIALIWHVFPVQMNEAFISRKKAHKFTELYFYFAYSCTFNTPEYNRRTKPSLRQQLQHERMVGKKCERWKIWQKQNTYQTENCDKRRHVANREQKKGVCVSLWSLCFSSCWRKMIWKKNKRTKYQHTDEKNEREKICRTKR